MASGDSMGKIFPGAYEPPATSFAVPDTRNNRSLIDFVEGESCYFKEILPANYGGGGLTFSVRWAASTATTGTVQWDIGIERLDDGGQDLDADGFAAVQNGSDTTNAASGVLTYTDVTFTSGAQMDSLVAGESYRIELTRNAAGTMTGDAELHSIHITET